MGRSSKNENTLNETTEFQEQPATTTFPYSNEPQTASNRAVSESESMARDIKEGRLSGFVGAGTMLTGETNFVSMLRIDGHLTGQVISEEGTLIIGATGQVDAGIKVAAAIVNGIVNGDIIASEKIELGRTAKIVGNIQTPRLIISDGGILEGNCSMVESKETREQIALEQKAQFATSDLQTEPAEDLAAEDSFVAEEEESSYFAETSETDEDEDENADAAAN
jgi:cytoskeletal protein CcmA (bactofilin family)